MKSLFFSFFSILLLTVSCSKKECTSAVYCPAISNGWGKMVPSEGTGALVYSNESGQELIFQIDELNLSEGKEQTCEYDDLGDECICEDCIPAAGFTSNCDDDSRTYDAGSTIQIFNQMNLEVKEYSYLSTEEIIFGEIQLFNYRIDSLQLLPLDQSSYSEYLTDFEVNGKTYENVIAMEADTNMKDAAYPWVWKVYFNKTDGIVAFYDLKTNSLFGLKNQ